MYCVPDNLYFLHIYFGSFFMLTNVYHIFSIIQIVIKTWYLWTYFYANMLHITNIAKKCLKRKGKPIKCYTSILGSIVSYSLFHVYLNGKIT